MERALAPSGSAGSLVEKKRPSLMPLPGLSLTGAKSAALLGTRRSSLSATGQSSAALMGTRRSSVSTTGQSACNTRPSTSAAQASSTRPSTTTSGYKDTSGSGRFQRFTQEEKSAFGSVCLGRCFRAAIRARSCRDLAEPLNDKHDVEEHSPEASTAALTPTGDGAAASSASSSPSTPLAQMCTDGPSGHRGLSDPSGPSDLPFEAAHLRYVLDRLLPVETLKTSNTPFVACGSATASLRRLAAAGESVGESTRQPAPKLLQTAGDRKTTTFAAERVESAGRGRNDSSDCFQVPAAMVNSSFASLNSSFTSLGPNSSFVAEPLEKLRRQLTRRCKCIHEVFARLERRVPREQALGLPAFKQALMRSGASEDSCTEVFGLLQVSRRGPRCGVSLMDLREAMIAAASDEILLKELKSHLTLAGIKPGETGKAVALMRSAAHVRREKRNRNKAFESLASMSSLMSAGIRDASQELEEEMDKDDAAAYSQVRLSHKEWEKLCLAIGLTVSEADRLAQIIGDPGALFCDSHARSVDLNRMFDKLRVALAPEVTLERFASKVLVRYGDFASAFHAVAVEDDGSWAKVRPTLMEERPTAPVCSAQIRWQEFQDLAVAVEVNNRSSASIWQLLVTASTRSTGRSPSDVWGLSPSTVDSGKEIFSVAAVGFDTFVEQLSAWAPGTALESLKGQVRERFASLAEFRREMKRRSLNRGEALSEASLQACLDTTGIICSTELLLETLRSRMGGQDVTLDDLMSALRAAPSGPQPVGKSSAAATVAEAMLPFWQRVQEFRADLHGMRVEESGELEGLCTSELITSSVASATLNRCSSSPNICQRSHWPPARQQSRPGLQRPRRQPPRARSGHEPGCSECN